MGESTELHVEMCRAVQELTTALLGATIAFSDSDWAAPSRLPGWTRSHVASHLAENAIALRRLVESVRDGAPPHLLYANDVERRDAIEEGAARSPLELQIALDTSAGLLATAFASLNDTQLARQVRLGSMNVPAKTIPLARLSEVALHHLDLADGFSLDDVADRVVLWCLDWQCRILGSAPHAPDYYVVAEEGFTALIGDAARAIELRGNARKLLVGLRNVKLAK